LDIKEVESAEVIGHLLNVWENQLDRLWEGVVILELHWQNMLDDFEVEVKEVERSSCMNLHVQSLVNFNFFGQKLTFSELPLKDVVSTLIEENGDHFLVLRWQKYAHSRTKLELVEIHGLIALV
jgi:hypothetical protein